MIRNSKPKEMTDYCFEIEGLHLHEEGKLELFLKLESVLHVVSINFHYLDSKASLHYIQVKLMRASDNLKASVGA
jgi:hypothetical protein